MAESGTQTPKVSIICLCYNHASFVRQCLQSVLSQTYQNIEIIVIDDASTDNSAQLIKSLVEENPEIQLLDLKENVGNCRAFNNGLRNATGKYIIDLSCDDVLAKDRVEKQVSAFEGLPEDFGVVYSDATYIDEAGHELGEHFRNYPPAKGDVYEELVRRYFIAPPTMMIRKTVFDELQGYDETLAYEDFDFWVRSSRNWKYDYIKEPLTLVRKTQGSLSSRFYQRNSPLIDTTLEVCKKIKTLNRNSVEDQALVQRLRYELKMASITGSRFASRGLYVLLNSLEAGDWRSRCWLFFSSLNWNVFPLVKVFKKDY